MSIAKGREANLAFVYQLSVFVFIKKNAINQSESKMIKVHDWINKFRYGALNKLSNMDGFGFG